jgi:hypothetical protein
MKRILSLIAATALVFVASETALARRWFFQRRRPPCVNQPLGCVPCAPIAPCLCPQEVATDPEDPDPDLFYYHVEWHDCDCANDEQCNEPETTVMATDGFIDFPQLCQNPADCEFIEAKRGSRTVLRVGLPAPKTPTFTPRIWDVPAGSERLIDDGCLKFYLDNPSDPAHPIEKYARFCLFRLPRHDHDRSPTGAPPIEHTAKTFAIGFEIAAPRPGDPPLNLIYDVDKRYVKEKPYYEYVHHVDTGAVTYPVIMVQ